MRIRKSLRYKETSSIGATQSSKEQGDRELYVRSARVATLGAAAARFDSGPGTSLYASHTTLRFARRHLGASTMGGFLEGLTDERADKARVS